MTILSKSTQLAFVVAFSFALKPAVADESKSPTFVDSPGGFRAQFVKLAGEGEGKTIISKDGKKLKEIPSVFPMSFSPTDDVLLVAEYAPDDDCRQYLLNIGKGEYARKGSRLDYVFGGRYCVKAIWSQDGKKITLYYHKLSQIKEETFAVDDLLDQDNKKQ